MEPLAELSGMLLLIVIVLPIVVLILFFVLVDNVSKIKKEIVRVREITSPIWIENDFLAQREIFKGNKEKALEYYKNMQFELQYQRPRVPWKDRQEWIEKRIKELEK